MVVTFTTVGYGEKTPITNMGKVFVMTWMFVGLGFYCLFTVGAVQAANPADPQRLKGAWF